MIVTVDAEEFPIAAISRVIVVIDVFVVHGEFAQTLALELPTTACADMGKKLKRPGTVTRLSRFGVAAKFSEKSGLPFGGRWSRFGLHGSFRQARIFFGTGQGKSIGAAMGN